MNWGACKIDRITYFMLNLSGHLQMHPQLEVPSISQEMKQRQIITCVVFLAERTHFIELLDFIL